MDDNCGEWVESMGAVSRRWVESMGVVRMYTLGVVTVSGCCCKEVRTVYRFPHNNYYLFLLHFY